MWMKRKVWWLTNKDGSTTYFRSSKPVNEERARIMSLRDLHPSRSISSVLNEVNDFMEAKFGKIS